MQGISDEVVKVQLDTEEAMQGFGAALARLARIGDSLLLSGPVGSGKSTLARAFIRERLASPAEEIPSPTFTLVQTYEHETGDIWHCDLYRLTSTDEIIELGLTEAFQSAICLIEWPDRLGEDAPKEGLRINLSMHPNGRIARLAGTSDWNERLREFHG